eukprot:scaffold108776_cov32-Tisochrysis_lutea.AAC.1
MMLIAERKPEASVRFVFENERFVTGVNGGLAPPSLHRGHPSGWARTINPSPIPSPCPLAASRGEGQGTHHFSLDPRAAHRPRTALPRLHGACPRANSPPIPGRQAYRRLWVAPMRLPAFLCLC